MATLTAAEATFDAWKRLRTLTDVVQEQQKEGEHLDRKVRFALVVMGLLNTAVVLGIRGQGPDAVAVGLLVALVLVDGYFFAHVVTALMPRDPARSGGGGVGGGPRLRSAAEIARADPESYRRAWQDVDLDQLLAELAAQAHALGTANTRKARLIRRLLMSLHAMTVLAAACVAWTAWR